MQLKCCKSCSWSVRYNERVRYICYLAAFLIWSNNGLIRFYLLSGLSNNSTYLRTLRGRSISPRSCPLLRLEESSSSLSTSRPLSVFVGESSRLAIICCCCSCCWCCCCCCWCCCCCCWCCWCCNKLLLPPCRWWMWCACVISTSFGVSARNAKE